MKPHRALTFLAIAGFCGLAHAGTLAFDAGLVSGQASGMIPLRDSAASLAARGADHSHYQGFQLGAVYALDNEPVAFTASVEQARGDVDLQRQALGAFYQFQPSPKLAISTGVQYAHQRIEIDGTSGYGHDDLGLVLGTSYQLGHGIALAGSLEAGRQSGNAYGNGSDTAGMVELSFARLPFPGAVTVDWRQTRSFSYGGPYLGEQYVNTRELGLSYSRAF